MKHNEFDNEIKYRLFRSVKEILHPAISKRNISNYIIVLDEEILPIRVFYPKKVTEMHKVIIYVHGNATITDCTSEYSSICKNMSVKTNHLVIAIEYQEHAKQYQKMVKEIEKTIEYLYQRLTLDGIEKEDITLVGDSTGATIITGLEDEKIPNRNFNLNLMKNIEEYYNYLLQEDDYQNLMLNPLNKSLSNKPKTLVMVGKVDCLKDEDKEYFDKLKGEGHKYVELPFSTHGFLKNMDKELAEEVYGELNLFL